MRQGLLLVVCSLWATMATAQDRQADQAAVATGSQVGQTADVSGGQVGQRQTREQAAPTIKPMGRIASRVQNRVQSRVRNRLDRFYDPQANAASPFEIAGDRTRTAGRPRRR